MSTPTASKSNDPDTRSGIDLEQEGHRRIERVLDAVEREPWSITLLQLAWTAGPVTYVAAQGGYWLGYKDFLPADRIAFFIGYTVIAGVIGIMTKLIWDDAQRRRKDRREQSLTTAIDRLPELIFAVRNLALAALPPDVRQREAAWLLLLKAELGPVSLGVAVEDLTGSALLADVARRAEIYRRNGLRERARDLLDEQKDLLALVLDELRGAAPAIAFALRERLEGRGVSVKRGVPREENFIERILAAIEEENHALMTLKDVEEMLLLAFELINGREILALSFNYRGRWQLQRATDALEQARTDYRIGKAMGYSRLKALVTFLTERDTDLAEQVAGQPTAVLVEKVQQTFDELVDAIYRLRVEVANGRRAVLDELQDKAETLAIGLNLYKAMQAAYGEMTRRHGTLMKARTRWEALSARVPAGATQLRTGRGRWGLRIAERTIRLDDDAKVEVAQALERPLRSLDLRRRGRRGPRDELRPLTVESAKDLAVDVALVLEDFIHISRPSVQRALNASNACLLAGIEPGMSAGAKAAVGAAIAKEVQSDAGAAAERLASALVRHYRIDLGARAIDFLHRTYGADPATLNVLAAVTEPAPIMPVSKLRPRPPVLPAIEPAWERQLRRARRLLAANDREI